MLGVGGRKGGHSIEHSRSAVGLSSAVPLCMPLRVGCPCLLTAVSRAMAQPARPPVRPSGWELANLTSGQG